MLKMTMHCDHTIFRRFSNFRFSLVPTQGSSLTFSLAGQSGQPKSGLAGPQLVWLARDTFIGFGQPIMITIY